MKNLTEKIRGPIGKIWADAAPIDQDIETAGFDWHYIYDEITHFIWRRVCEQVEDCIQDQIEDITE